MPLYGVGYQVEGRTDPKYFIGGDHGRRLVAVVDGDGIRHEGRELEIDTDTGRYVQYKLDDKGEYIPSFGELMKEGGYYKLPITLVLDDGTEVR